MWAKNCRPRPALDGVLEAFGGTLGLEQSSRPGRPGGDSGQERPHRTEAEGDPAGRGDPEDRLECQAHVWDGGSLLSARGVRRLSAPPLAKL